MGFNRLVILYAVLVLMNSGCSLNIRSVMGLNQLSSIISPQPRKIYSSDEHFCINDSDGSLKCWGNNNFGQIKKHKEWNPNLIPGFSPSLVRPDSPQLVPPSSVNPIRDLAIGNSHTCVVLEPGELWCWGANGSGQLRSQNTSTQASYVKALSENVTSVSAGANHTCAIQSGALLCWGANASGQLGNGATQTNVLTPVQVFSSGVTQVSLQGNNSCAVVNEALYCWGNNTNGQVGNGVVSAVVSSPFQVFSSGVTRVETGQFHSCALHLGKLKCWGANSSGQIGNGTTSSTVLVPFEVFQNSITGFAIADHATCAIVNSSLNCWGTQSNGILGNGQTAGSSSTPSVILNSVRKVQMYGSHACAILLDQSLKCWGTGLNGIKGDGTAPATLSTPTLVLNSVSDIRTGLINVCAMIDNELKCWGKNTNRILGLGDTANHFTPTRILGPLYFNQSYANSATLPGYSPLSLGDHESCLIEYGGSLKCWGRNTNGQVGNGVLGVPQIAPFEIFPSGVTQVSVGTTTTCAIRNTALYCWGKNINGLIGGATSAGSPSNFISEPRLLFAGGVSSVSVGSSHACAVVNDSVACWGLNSSGQLGNQVNPGNFISYLPVISQFNASALQVSVGLAHTCVLLSDGSLHCWGSNYTGQVGNGSITTNVLIPYPVFTSGVSQFWVSENSSCAIHQSKLKCWGSNDNQWIMASPDAAIMQPHEVFSESVDQVSFMNSSACVRLPDASLKCWGANSYGKVGNGSISLSESVPFLTLESDVNYISQGKYHVCAIKSEALYCWGLNENFEHGNKLPSEMTLAQPYEVFSSGVTRAALTNTSTCVLHENQVKCWGGNEKGQVGKGVESLASELHVLNLPNPTDLAAGGEHVCAVSQGKLYCWGDNVEHQSGGPEALNRNPRLVDGLEQDVLKVFSNFYTNCALKNDQSIWCFGGQNRYNLLNAPVVNGVFNISVINNLQPVVPPSTNGVLVDLSLGAGNMCALYDFFDTKKLFCWGNNYNYQIVNDGLVHAGALSSAEIMNDPGIQKIYSGDWFLDSGLYSNCFILNGALKCKGVGLYGMAINANFMRDYDGHLYTVFEGGVEDLTMNSVNTACAIVDDEVKCWGYNYLKTMGDFGLPYVNYAPVTLFTLGH